MKSIIKKIVGVTLILVILASTNVALAVTQSEINAQKQEQENAQNKINETQAKKEEVSAQKNAVQQEVDNLNNKISTYEGQISTLDNQIDEANTKIAEQETKLAQAEKEYNEKENLIKQRMVAVYMYGNSTSLDMILGSKDLADLISGSYLVSQVTQMDVELLDKIQQQKEYIENTKKEIETNKETLTTSKTQKESVNTELKQAKQEKATKVAELSSEEQDLQKELDDLRNYESSVSSKIASMKKQYDAQIAAAKAKSSSSKNSSSGKQATGTLSGATSSYGFGWPVANHSIGTGFGVSGKYWSLGYHTGVDFPVPSGTTIYAVGDGQVVDTGYSNAYGRFVEIYHGNNVYSFYAHGSSVSVSTGQTVTKGQAIMLSGASGNVTGAHLHFEIRSPGAKFANCVNPMAYLP